MRPAARGEARQRRLLTRALPLTLLAACAFGAGLLAGAGPELGAAQRFADAWERRDLEAMHAQLAADAARRYPFRSFAGAYEEAERTATVREIDAGDAAEGDATDGSDAAVVPITVHTHAFGTTDGELALPLDDELVDWSPELVYPGLRPGEALKRRTRAPERAQILAADGTPLAEGPAFARSSPIGLAAAAVVGEVGTPRRKQAEALEERGFPPGSLSGISGLELAFNRRLAGQPSGQLLAVRARGGEERVLAAGEPQAGKPVRTTVDPELQAAAVAALGGTYGGIAALDARDGSVLALAGIAFSAPQPPGSTFKVITTAAALDAGVVALADSFPVLTSTVIDGREIANAHDEPCGGSFADSFARSCNTVFAPLGPRIGVERLVEAAEKFGFNSQPALYDEAATAAVDPPASTIPSSIPTDLDLAVTAIGQGEVLATPLAMASVAQAIAAGGVRSPTSIVDEPGLRPAAEPVRVTSERTASTVRELMVRAVSEGTGTAAAIPGVRVAGKTGTAELGPKPLEPGQKGTAEPEQEVDAWFTSFAPADDPRLAVAVMIVNAEGDGGEVAAPIAREVLAAGLG